MVCIDMTRTRQVASRCRSTPNPQKASSIGSHQNTNVYQQSKLIANIESSHEEVQAKPFVAENPPVARGRTSPYWTVDIIGVI